MRGAAEPACEHGFPTEAAGLAREDDEDRLSDILGQMRIAHLPECGGVDKRKVTLDELRERGLGLAGGVFGKEFSVTSHLSH